MAGLPASGGSADWKVLGPVAAPTGSCADVSFAGAPRFTSGMASMVDGPNAIGPTPKIAVAGCYAFSEVLSSTNGAFAPVAAGPTPNESEYLAPTLTTSASTSGPGAYSTLSDAATIEGLGSTSATLSWKVLGPVPANASGSCANASWTGAPTFASGTLTPTNGVNKIGPTKLLAPFAGCYTFEDSLSSPAFATLSPGISPAETVVLTPTLSTQATQSGEAAGSTLSDTASIGGLGLTQPSVLKWAIYGPIAPNKSGTCSGLSWAGAPLFESEQVPGANGLVVTGSSIPIVTAGCYGYQDTLILPNGEFAPVVAGVTTSETAYLTPSLTTRAVSTSVNGVGPSVPGTARLSDNVTLTGVDPTSSVIAWQVYGPVSGEACSAVNWAKAPRFASGSEQVPGASFTITVPQSVVENGCYAFADTVTSTDHLFAPLVVPPGVAAETVAGSIGSAGAAAPGVVNSGHPGPPVQGDPWLIGTGAGVIALGLGLAVYGLTDRRRDPVLPES